MSDVVGRKTIAADIGQQCGHKIETREWIVIGSTLFEPYLEGFKALLFAGRVAICKVRVRSLVRSGITVLERP